jgi:hypothetical protein
MHSYWDDFFALRGFHDAAWLARTIGQDAEGAHLDTLHAQFERDLMASIAAAMRRQGIDYIPGCADLGDFDATSTTIALSPGGALGALPKAAVDTTFERYWRFFDFRRDGRSPWEAFTPYEVRTIGAFVRLGWRDRADALVRWFMDTRRPAGWAQWPEVVWHDMRAPHFIGDLPHTWVGSDFVRSVLDMLAYEDDDGTIVLGAGVPWRWVAGPGGVRVRGLSTAAGPLSFRMRADGDVVRVEIDAGLRVPDGGLLVRPPARVAFRAVTVNGAAGLLAADGGVRIMALPVAIVFSP